MTNNDFNYKQTDMGKGKHNVLIIGGTSGMGFETAKLFADRLYQVFILGRDKEKGEKAVELIKKTTGKDVYYIQRDITKDKPDEIERSIKPEIVINSAGIFDANPNDLQNYHEIYEKTKLGGLDYCKRFHLYHNPNIKHLISISSLYTYLPETFVPAMEKKVNLDVEKEIKKIAKKNKGKFNANCIAPGLVNTPLVQTTYSDKDKAEILAAAPGSRIVQPEEIAKKIYEICTKGNVETGAVIPVDGSFLKNFKG